MNYNNKICIKISMEQASVTNGGRFEGWGSSLCWWANRVGYSEVLANETAGLFYGKEGLRLNIMRYNIGGGDDPEHHHIERTDSDIPGWMKWSGQEKRYVYDYEADKNQLNVLKKCYENAGEEAYVEAFSNSAPYFMTVSGCSSGGENPSEDNLKEECYEEFAEYLAHVSKYINDTLNIKVKSIAAMNEPNTDYWQYLSPKQEGCHFEPGTSQSKMLIETAKAFETAGLSHIVVSASDETSTDKQLLSCEMYSDEAWKIIDRVSTHTYGVEKIGELGEYVKKKQYNLWMSEVDGCFTIGEDSGEMAAALGYAKKIIDDMNKLSPSAWVMWQLIDSHISKKGYKGKVDFGMPNLLDGYWGVAVADHDNEKVILTKKYYAMGQFTRYIRPGSRIIHCGDNSLASYNEKDGTLSIVVVNTEKEDVAFDIDVSEFCFNGGKVKVIRTSGNMENGENWKVLPDMCVENGRICGKLKGYSVTTYYCGA